MSVSKVTSYSVVLTWQRTSSFQFVLIRYRVTDGRTEGMCEELYDRPGSDRITVFGLTELSDYEFYVAFVNSAGCSLASGPQYASTTRSGTVRYMTCVLYDTICKHLMTSSWLSLPRMTSKTEQINNNKSAQSNFGREPLCGTVAHVRRKVPIGQNGAPQIRPQKYPFPWIDPKPHYLPHPWARPIYGAKWHPDPICRFFHNALDRPDRPTHGRTDRRTDSQTDRSSTGKFNHYRPLRYESDAA